MKYKNDQSTWQYHCLQPFVSVIIPVFNDPERLLVCLNALEKQTYSKDFFEIIVVDNGSDESIKPIVEDFPRVKLEFEPRRSSYAARNKGISIAKGEVIAFTDSDCIPAKDWLHKGVERLLQSPQNGLLGGKINIFFKNHKKPTMVEIYEKYCAFPQKHYIINEKFGATANVFTLKKVVDQIGVFDANLKSGGDYEWGRRVHSSGYNLIYADEVCVAHPARYNLYQVYKKRKKVVRGLETVNSQKKRFLKIFDKDLVLSFIPPVKIIFATIINNKPNVKEIMCVIFGILFTTYVAVFEKILARLGTSKSQ